MKFRPIFEWKLRLCKKRGTFDLRGEKNAGHRNRSRDFYGAGSENLGVSGYDMVTTLGSNLEFSGMTASITGAQWIDL